MSKNRIIEIICALFILLFAYTALSKLLNFESFKQVLSLSPSIGENAPIIAWTLPIVELIVASLLFIPRTRTQGLYGSFSLMVVFTIYLSYMLAATPDLPCTCGGVLSQMTWNQHLVFNIFFTLIALFGIIINKRSKKPKQGEEVTRVSFS